MVITGAIQSPINNANVAEMRFWFLGNQIKHRSLSEGRKYNRELFHLGRMQVVCEADLLVLMLLVRQDRHDDRKM